MPSRAPSSERERLNVVFIICHDFGPRIECFGDRQAVTPYIDQLAGDDGSLRFLRHYANWPLCGPSRANIWTGCRPPTTQRYDNDSFFPEFRQRMGPGFETLSEHFKNQGYHTMGVWQVFHGFERDDPSWSTPGWFPSLPTPEIPDYVPDDQYDHYYWWVDDDSFALVRDRMQRWAAQGHPFNEPRRYRGPGVEAADVADDAYVEGRATSEAVEWIEQYAESAPFYLAIGYEIGHLPFCAPQKYWDLYDRNSLSIPGAADQPPSSPSWIMGDKEPAQYYWQHSYDRVWHPSYEEQKELLHGHYAAMSYWDAQVGRLVDALERKGLRDNTVIVVTTDHGFADGEHGYWGKHNMWEESMHVPLLINVPGHESPVSATERLTEHVDLYPTLCDLCGLPLPDYLEGSSLAPLYDDPVREWKEAIFCWRRPMYHDLHKNYNEARGLRTERYRYTSYEDAAGRMLYAELFDLEADPCATQNLADDADTQELVAGLRRQLDRGWRPVAARLAEAT